MKKRIFLTTTYFSLLSLLSVFYGCDKYLDVNPDDRKELTTLEDLHELLGSAYSEAAYNFIEWKTDNAVAVKDNVQQDFLTENFLWQPVVSSEAQDTPSYLWINNYNAIAHANQALAVLDEMTNTDDDLKKAIQGEALITRAYNHFILANVFCQHYQQDTASSELGIPYVTTPEKEINPSYERGTLQETYDQIEKDLLAAIPLINNSFRKGLGKYHFSIEAAYAFASRFYLFKGKYDNCIKYSDTLLGGGVVNTTYIRDMRDVFKGSSSEQIASQFSDASLPANLLLVRKETLNVTRVYEGYRSDFPTLEGLFSRFSNIQKDSDIRRSYWNPVSDAKRLPKFREYFSSVTDETGFPYFIMLELRGEEVVLNRMEAYVRMGRLDEALADYHVFASLRYENGGELDKSTIVEHYGGTEQEAMLKFIIEERRKEFVHEGLRWWDIKRLNLAIRHTDVIGNTEMLETNDLRKAEQIPRFAENIKPNPR